jgi:VanZ family protein
MEARHWFLWLYPVALTGMIFFASGRGQVAAPPVVNIDKATHFFVFGLLATIVVRARGTAKASAGQWWAGAILAVSAFGAFDEFRQSFTPGRMVELADWVADTAGAIVAVVLYRFWRPYRQVLEMPLRWRARRFESKLPTSVSTQS